MATMNCLYCHLPLPAGSHVFRRYHAGTCRIQAERERNLAYFYEFRSKGLTKGRRYKVKTKPILETRKCLKCGRKFSTDQHYRTCPGCREQNGHLAAYAGAW